MMQLSQHDITPLASLLRPNRLEDIVGQSHLLGVGKPIRKFLESGKMPSLLFWGPPGCGKTSLARVIANTIDAEFHHLSGVLSKKDDVVRIIVGAQKNFSRGRQTILFLDEIHRWTKSQQDVLLPWVEKGVVTLIGATTENPSFTVINALLSRCSTYILESISLDDVEIFLIKNIEAIEHRYPAISFREDSYSDQQHHDEQKGENINPLRLIARLGNGDMRSTLNLLETASLLQGSGVLTRETILEAGNMPLTYDQNGEEHYNLISAVHKSLRDSDGDAAVYWIGRMLAAGEDPRFIARRMMNFASEDIYDPQAIILTNSVYEICEKMGMPECELPLLNVAYYLADAPKNNTIYRAMQMMHEDIREHGSLGVPLHLRNAPTKLMKEAGYGAGYISVHNLTHGSPREKEYPEMTQEHFPEKLKGRKYRQK